MSTWGTKKQETSLVDTKSVLTSDLTELLYTCIALCLDAGCGFLIGQTKNKSAIVLTVMPRYSDKQSVYVKTFEEMFTALEELYTALKEKKIA